LCERVRPGTLQLGKTVGAYFGAPAPCPQNDAPTLRSRY